MKKEMLINVLQAEECRIAIVENGTLEELYVERSSQESYVGNIYKGRIVNIEPNIQAAFVDFGIGRNGFLHVSDVDPIYYRHLEPGGRAPRPGGSSSSSTSTRDDYAERGDRDARGDRGNDRGSRNDRNDRGNSRGRNDRNDRGGERGNDRGNDRNRGRNDRGGDRAERQPRQERGSYSVYPTDVEIPSGVEPVASNDLTSWLPEGGIPEAMPVEAETPESAPPHAPTPAPAPIAKETPPPIRTAPEEPSFGFGVGILDETPFGAGIELDPEPASAPISHTPAVKHHEKPAIEVAEPVEESTGDDSTLESAVAIEEPDSEPEPEPEAEPKPRKRSSRRAAASTPAPIAAVEPAAPKKRRSRKVEAEPEPEPEPEVAEAVEAETPASDEPETPKRRRTRSTTPSPRRKKTDTNDGDDDKPRTMDSAERRTAGDESELFGDGGGFGSGLELPSEPAISKHAAPRVDHEPRERAQHEHRDDRHDDHRHDERHEDRHPTRIEEPRFVASHDHAEEPHQERQERYDDVNEELEDEAGSSLDHGEEADADEDGEEAPSRDRNRRPSNGGPNRGAPRGNSRGGRPPLGRPRPLIQDIFKRGQEVIVQVIKEPLGTKGPTLSTYVSIAGRYLVLMPGLNRIGVSRKIQDDHIRARLKDMLQDMRPPKGLGFIIRTAGMDRSDPEWERDLDRYRLELQTDFAYLLRLWQVVVDRIRKTTGPSEIYRETDMITRTIRDIFTNDIDSILVDEPTAFAQASDFLKIVMPRYANRIKYYDSTEPLFHKYKIEDEISRIQQKTVPLPMGGSIVIEQTEALVAIDVNSGSFRGESNAEESAYQMNLQAAKEIARQLRLRDLGGVIVNDFIDMREERHRRNVEKAMHDAVRRDRARTKVLRISAFGIIEMTRQRIRPSLKRSVYRECVHCKGSGSVKTNESVSIEAMRLLQLASHRAGIAQIQLRVHGDVAHYLLNRKRKELSKLEETGKLHISIVSDLHVPPETMDFTCLDAMNSEVKFLFNEPPVRPLPQGRRGYDSRPRQPAMNRGGDRD